MPESHSKVTIVRPGPSSRASRMAPAMLIPTSRRAQSFLFDEVEDEAQRLLVRNAVGEIDRRGLEIGGDARLADALGDRGAFALENATGVIGVERRAIGVGQRDLDPLSRSFSAMATPASVPPVPTALTKPSTRPWVCSQISGPVVS